MQNEQQISIWKKTLKWIATGLVAVVVLDWLLDGRLRQRLSFRRRRTSDPV